jgi:hypothetical protein
VGGRVVESAGVVGRGVVDPAVVEPLGVVEPPRVGDPAVDDPAADDPAVDDLADVVDPPGAVDPAVVGAEPPGCPLGCRCELAADVLRAGVVFRFVDCACVVGASATASVSAKSVS